MADYTLPQDRAYTSEHIWLLEDEDGFTLGISDFAQAQLEEVVYVDMPAVGDQLEAEKEFGSVESMKSVNALFMPVAGSVLEVNETLESTPTLVNAKPYNEGWMLRIRMDDPAEAATLADSAAYLNLLRKG